MFTYEQMAKLQAKSIASQNAAFQVLEKAKAQLKLAEESYAIAKKQAAISDEVVRDYLHNYKQFEAFLKANEE